MPPTTSPEVLSKISDLQGQVWQTVSLTASESAGFEITFSNPLTLTVPAPDVFAETTSPRLVIQFAFAGMPENAMLFLIPQETYGALAASIKGEQPGTIDEGLVSDIRPVIEAIVQGVCLAIGNSKNEPIVASGLSTRYQIPSFPPNLQKNEDLVRTNVEFSCEDFSGTLTWVMDAETAHSLVGAEYSDDATPVFSSISTGAGTTQFNHDSPGFDESGLEILMDIPLEVSVELGRVKMNVRDVVELGAGSIVEIDKAAGEPVDVLVNGRLVARGEVVVIDDNFGVRITEILSIQERLQKLNEAA